jgi:hypothetical protein
MTFIRSQCFIDNAVQDEDGEIATFQRLLYEQ